MPRSARPKPARTTPRAAGALARDPVTEAPDVARLAVLQAEWAGEECALAAQAWSGLLAALFDVQAAWWRGAEAAALVWMKPWVAGAAGQPAFASALEGPRELSPPVLLRSAADAWQIVGRACISALDHDLAAPAR
jgi:hypothetical protein